MEYGNRLRFPSETNGRTALRGQGPYTMNDNTRARVTGKKVFTIALRRQASTNQKAARAIPTCGLANAKKRLIGGGNSTASSTKASRLPSPNALPPGGDSRNSPL